jgi:hypothetical protein
MRQPGDEAIGNDTAKRRSPRCQNHPIAQLPDSQCASAPLALLELAPDPLGIGRVDRRPAGHG